MKKDLCLYLMSLLALVVLIDGKLSENVELSEIVHLRRSKDFPSNIKAGHQKVHHSTLDSDGASCEKIVAYYEGTFKNQENSNLEYTAQFQVHLEASQSDQRIHVIFDRWNNSLLSNKPFSFDFAYDNKDIWGDQIGASYSGSFASKPGDFLLTLDHQKHRKWDNGINILYFNVFNNSFQLENSIGQCTANQLELHSVYNMDTSLVNYCVCCGDYAPDEEFLDCPKNPWAKKASTPSAKTTVLPKKASTLSAKTTVLPKKASTPSAKTTVLPKKASTPSVKTTVLTKKVSTPSTKTTIVPEKTSISSAKITDFPRKVSTFPAKTTHSPYSQCITGNCDKGSLPKCSANSECYCFKTSDNHSICALDAYCNTLKSCDDCPSDFGVCSVETCCGIPICYPLVLLEQCTVPPTQASLEMAQFNRRKQCKNDLECAASGKLCKQHMSGMFCA